MRPSGSPKDPTLTQTREFGRSVILQPYSEDQAEDLIAALADRDLLRWLAALPVPLDRETGEQYLKFLGDPDVNAQVLSVDGTLAGVVSLGTELSFWISREHHGKGLGSWAVRTFLCRLPADTGLVTACCMTGNVAAIAVLEKLGFSRVGPTFRRFSFADGQAMEFLRFQYSRQV